MSVPSPMPSEWPLILDANEASTIRKLHCRQYNACLRVAWRSRWTGFSCQKCSAYAPISRYEARRDLEGLARFTSALIAELRAGA